MSARRTEPWAQPIYLDASALVKLFVPEPETVYEEGCLSFPQIRGDICRPDEITVKFKDVTGHAHVLQCDGLLSRCVQHEVDHLNGILFIDRMNSATRTSLAGKLKRLQKSTRG